MIPQQATLYVYIELISINDETDSIKPKRRDLKKILKVHEFEEFGDQGWRFNKNQTCYGIKLTNNFKEAQRQPFSESYCITQIKEPIPAGISMFIVKLQKNITKGMKKFSDVVVGVVRNTNKLNV